MGEKLYRELYTAGAPMLREADDGEKSRTIEGYAVVFERESEVLADWYDGAFREVISKGALTAETLAACDVKMTLWHNRERLLARSVNGQGTLTLEVDDTGVKYRFEAPHTSDGATALELVRRGDITGASFAYVANEKNVDYTREADKVLLRRVNKIDAIFDCTLASDPAYPDTTAQVREAPKKVQELLRAEREGADAEKETEAASEVRSAVTRARGVVDAVFDLL